MQIPVSCLYNMEAMGADVSQKIRSAIKAKLVELGAYVDDELPDYIMVMVANKKSKMQMDADLLLFLGNNTKKFTNWLNQVLERLQSVTGDVTKKRKTSAESQLRSDSGTKSRRLQMEQEMKLTDDKKIQFEAEELDVQDEILAIKADLEADDLLSQEIEGSDKLITESLAKGNKPLQMPSTTQRVNLTSKEHSTIISKNGQQTQRGTKRMSSSLQPTLQKRRAPSSMVGAIVTRETEDDDDNIHTSGLASVVKISERRSSVPPSMQANKNLIMKAVAEAKKSVVEAARKQTNFYLGKQETLEPEPTRELFTRKYRGESLTSNVVSSTVSQSELPDYEDEDMEMSEIFDSSSQPNIRSTTSALLEMLQRSNNENYSTNKMGPNRHFVQDNGGETRAESPRFIVTLDGINAESFTSKYSVPVLKGMRSIDQDENDDDDDLMQYELDEDNDIVEEMGNGENVKGKGAKKSTERCKYWPTCKNGIKCLYHHPNKQCKTFPNCRFGEKCLYVHPNCKYDASCTKNNCPFTHANKRQPPPISSVTQHSLPQRDKKCKFFPNCSNVNCSFYHPKPCRYGLSCTQSGCTFYHPPLPSREKLKWSSTVATAETTKKV